jgi:hypothetical protein
MVVPPKRISRHTGTAWLKPSHPFDDDLKGYLDEIRDRTSRFRELKNKTDGMQDGDADTARLVDEASDENDWLVAQPEVLKGRFKTLLPALELNS